MSNHPHSSLLGKETAYPDHYDPALLFPIARQLNRAPLGIAEEALPFHGVDRWSAYELGWLNSKGMPQVAVASFYIPATSPNLIESKSFKLYLNSFNNARYEGRAAVESVLLRDLSAACGAAVTMQWSLPDYASTNKASISLDTLDIAIDNYHAPDRDYLIYADKAQHVHESVHTALFKSNCPVTGQPDWATVLIDYTGMAMDHAGLLRYLISFRNHAEFHEACVERVFTDISTTLKPEQLRVEARYTRRGGLDINPWRASSTMAEPLHYQRDERQ